MRDLSPGTIAEMSAEQQRCAHLLSIALDDEVICLTDDATAIQFGGQTFYAAGQLLNIEFDGDADGLAINGTTATLSGVDQALIAATLQTRFVGRAMNVWRAYFNSAGVMQEPLLLFSGRCDGPAIEENVDDGSSVVQIRASSHFVDFERVNGRLTNDESQQRHFPGDRGFEFVTTLGKELQWGGR
ncbi:DUF2163 domain-containing protein [Chitinibacter sp. GC72]|uniref:baseplate hub protein n=1 Tax=Chitinibacter sp. GC72 TaxID=1526917 RepID=UPI0012F7B32F|nr:DUF2163 domain-containing protein [Chitinibacter sp. GC72]